MTKLLLPLVASLLAFNAVNAGELPPTKQAEVNPPSLDSFAINHKPVTGQEVKPDQQAPKVEGHPLTSVVVTQCNLIVAVYITMPDGRLFRYDHTANIPADQLLAMAYTATRSERVEVSCNGEGADGYEKHDPV
jgi:hypothetical protein